MTNDTVFAWATLLNAIAWPIIILVVALILRNVIPLAISNGGAVRLRFKNLAEFSIDPAIGLRPPSTSSKPSKQYPQFTNAVDKNIQISSGHIPLDYYFLNHVSFLRTDKQPEFRKRTGFDLDHYDIRVTVDSYYQGALDKIDYVEYVLHRGYPQPRQIRSNAEDKFLLKELANGEYVLMAKVYLIDQKMPILLQRYISLYNPETSSNEKQLTKEEQESGQSVKAK